LKKRRCDLDILILLETGRALEAYTGSARKEAVTYLQYIRITTK
jgi:hypothetical protein